jgi:hypothetical protein
MNIGSARLAFGPSPVMRNCRSTSELSRFVRGNSQLQSINLTVYSLERGTCSPNCRNASHILILNSLRRKIVGVPTTMTLITWLMIATDTKSSRALTRIATASDQEHYSRGKTSSDIIPFVFLSVFKTHGIWRGLTDQFTDVPCCETCNFCGVNIDRVRKYVMHFDNCKTRKEGQRGPEFKSKENNAIERRMILHNRAA